MLSVVPLRYGTAFKKAFSDPLAFAALVKAALDIDFTPGLIHQEHSFRPAVAHVNIAYDLFAEDTAHRTIVELQHVRDDESYDRFLYYHCMALGEQIVSSDNYRFPRDVYTLVLLTRWPESPRLRFGRATCDLDPVTEEGKKLGVYRHRLVFINAKAPPEMLPLALRPLMALVEDTLDGEVDESKYPDEVSRRILEKILKSGLDPDENARVKEEATWENAKRESLEQGLREGEARGEARGLREGKTEGLRSAVADLCEVLGVSLTEARRAHLAALDLVGLEALRLELKATKAWPEGSNLLA